MPKLEEEQYVCLCGSREFMIFPTYLECSKCRVRYNYYHGFLQEPKVFNGRRESLKKKT
jgi:hypothetical protein